MIVKMYCTYLFKNKQIATIKKYQKYRVQKVEDKRSEQ